MEVYVNDMFTPSSISSTTTSTNEDMKVSCVNLDGHLATSLASNSDSEIMTSSCFNGHLATSLASNSDSGIMTSSSFDGHLATSLASNSDSEIMISSRFDGHLATSLASNSDSGIMTSSYNTGFQKNYKHRVSKVLNLILDDIYFVRRLGSGDIGTVYLVELKGSSKGHMFAAKVMDKEEMAYRNKESRAGIEREILQMLDHPFLPSLYATLECPKWSCLFTEFCPGGDLHVLRQHQPEKRFDNHAVRFYASEVVVALEYLHMIGIIYRDLKPENVLVKSDGHIMLTDFDLSLKCDYNSKSKPQLIYDPIEPKTHYPPNNHKTRFSKISSCILPRVSCLGHGPRHRKKVSRQCGALKIVAEPTEARSTSFVGTHEYLAPEIVSGEGHGNAVDWWTLGIFIYELLYGVTPFRGIENEFTLANIVARGLEFPKEPMVEPLAKDLISELLNKDPSKRMGSMMGATSIKHHPFFKGVNWALLRCTKPPYIPSPYSNSRDFVSSNDDQFDGNVDYY